LINVVLYNNTKIEVSSLRPPQSAKKKFGHLDLVAFKLTSASTPALGIQCPIDAFIMPKFVPREHKHRKITRTKDSGTTSTNATELPASSATSHDARKAALTTTLTQPHMSSKKRKRLDKYIDTKLRREDTLALIKRLEEKQRDVDRSLLQSAKKLGRKGETRREVYERALKERGRGVRVEEAEAVLFERPRIGKMRDEEGEDDEEDESEGGGEGGGEEDGRAGDDEAQGERQKTEQPVEGVVQEDKSLEAIHAPAVQAPTSAFGSGLKRPLELDEAGRPIIKKRKRTRGGPILFDIPNVQPRIEQPEWTGFSDDGEDAAQINDMEHDDDDIPDEIDSQEEVESSEDEDNDDVSHDSSDSDDGPASEPESDDSSIDSATRSVRKARTSAFKAWAEQQRNDTVGFTPSASTGPNFPLITDAIRQNFRPRAAEADPLPEHLQPTQSSLAKDRETYAVHVERSPQIQEARLALPVLAEEHRIMESIFYHDVVIISGATGSGKTTQIPQFLFEHGFGSPLGPTPGMIGVTQPRRVAAVSMARRVAEELGEKHAKAVAHQVRFESTVGKATAVKFMTDGVLLREMSSDFALKKYSAIVVDEAHERTVNTDILIALLSRCVKIRRQLASEAPSTYQPLKLIIMSATLRVSDFRENSRLFAQPPPIIEAEGRQHGVTIHWARRTGHDYVEEAFKKICRGHRKLPTGGMLVFLTGQEEIRRLGTMLRDVFECTEETKDRQGGVKVQIKAGEMDLEEEDWEGVDEENEDIPEDESDADANAESEEDPDAEFAIEGEEPESTVQKIHLLPLYSQLPAKDQLRVFHPPPDGSRLIILSTNIAETSLTIPNIRYVIDGGRAKQKTMTRTGVQQFRTTWVSKASASQRSGRAGRTGPGHAWRLYSSAVYEDAMPEFSDPEILRAGLEGVVLQLKGLGVEKVDGFPWPTPPPTPGVQKAERLLRNLGALDEAGRITATGRELGKYPLSPRFATMLRLGVRYGVISEVIAIVAALDVPELAVPENQLDLVTPPREEGRVWSAQDDARETAREGRRKKYGEAMSRLSRLDADKAKLKPQSDALRLFAAVLDYTSSGTTEMDKEEFCRTNFLREKGMREASLLREQLSSITAHVSDVAMARELKEPKPKTVALLKQIVAAGFLDHIALRADCLPSPPVEERKAKRAIEVKYKPLFSTRDSEDDAEAAVRGEEASDEEDFVYIHPSSVLARLPPNAVPRYVIFSSLQRSQPKHGGRGRVRMHPLSPVSAEQISVLARGTALLDIGKPVGKIGVLEKSEKGEERRECEVVAGLKGDAGHLAWPLCRKGVVQRRVAGKGWVVESWKG
jgi:ATP-dependent RNA helicase DHX37/DHR1